jgi:hypothetical protein
MDDADLRRRAFEENRRLVTAKADMQTNMNELVKVFTRAIAAHR